MKPNVSLPKSMSMDDLLLVIATGFCATTGNLNADGRSEGELKFQLPAFNHFVAEMSEVFPVSSIHSLSSNVTSHEESEIIVFPRTKIAGGFCWLKTFTLILCVPAG